jgi:hypothetical protein
MPSDNQIHKFVHGKNHTTPRWSMNSGFCFDFCCSINLWIGPWYASLDIDSAAPEAQSLNLFSVPSQIRGSYQSKPWTGFDLHIAVIFMSFSQIIFLWCRRSVCPLWMTLKVRDNPPSLWKMWNPIIQCRNQLCPLRIALKVRTFPLIQWKWTHTYPDPVCYPQRAQMLSLFPHIRFNQWKLAYLLSRADFTPRLTLSSTLYFPPYSSLPLTFPTFRRSNVFYLATNVSNLGDIG